MMELSLTSTLATLAGRMIPGSFDSRAIAVWDDIWPVGSYFLSSLGNKSKAAMFMHTFLPIVPMATCELVERLYRLLFIF